MTSARASISSLVSRPAPASRQTRRNGALLTPAMGASRRSSAFTASSCHALVEAAALHDDAKIVLHLERAEILQRVALDHDEVRVLLRLHGPDPVAHPEQLGVDLRGR